MEPPTADPATLREARWRRSKWIWAVAPVTLAVLVSLNTLWNGWVADDDTQIVRNTALQKLNNIPLSFTTSVWSYATSDVVFTVDTYYRPIFMSLFTVNYAIVGLRPWGWHLINLLIHAAATLLVFITIKELTKRPEIAALTAALFAVHPAHAESVAWASGITDPLMSLFLLPAFWCYLRLRDGGRRYLLGALVILYLLALFGKETAIALPLVIAYCELFHFKDLPSVKLRVARALPLAALIVVATVVYLGMRYIALDGILTGSGQHYAIAGALMTVPLAIVKYLKLVALPWGQSYQHYTEFVTSVSPTAFLLPLVLIVVMIAGIAVARSRLLAFGAVWFIALLAPALAGMRQFDPEYLIQDRYLYLPSIGFCLCLALGIDWLAKRYGVKAGIAAVAVLVAGYGVADIRQNRVWTNGLSAFQDCVDQDPGSVEARLALARVLFESGRIREGEDQARKALDLAPASPSPYLVLSYFARAAGKVDKSIEFLETGIPRVSESPITKFKLATMYLNLGLLQAQTKNPAAEHNLLRSLEVWPRVTGWYYTGLYYLDQGRYEDALSMLELALERVPRRFAPIHLKLGLTCEKLGQKERARSEYQRYLELLPSATDRSEVTRRISQLEPK